MSATSCFATVLLGIGGGLLVTAGKWQCILFLGVAAGLMFAVVIPHMGPPKR